MLIKISRIFALLLIVFTTSVFIPKFYWMKFEKGIRDPLVNYSPVNNDILVGKPTKRGIEWTDRQGNSYTRDEYEKLMPLFNYRQLLIDGKMPDSLKGVPLNPEVLRMNNFWLKIHPFDMDNKPIGLFPMFESKSGRVRLEMPDEYFRITDKFEFINCNTNSVNENKSGNFTNALNAQSFSFPAVMISGNPNVKKPFDEGYFVLDSKNKLFHIKMVKGNPFCVNTNIPDSLNILFMSISEMPLKEFYGYIFTKKGEIFLIGYNNYKLIKLPVPYYDFKTESFSIMGDLFYRTISLTDTKSVKTYVTDRNYNLVDTYTDSWKDNSEMNAGIVSSYLFPFTISMNDISSAYSNFFFAFSGYHFIFAGILFTIITFFILRRRNISLKQGWFDLVLVFFTGLFGFIAILLVKNIDNKMD